MLPNWAIILLLTSGILNAGLLLLWLQARTAREEWYRCYTNKSEECRDIRFDVGQERKAHQVLVETLNAQYQARLAQAERRADDKEVLVEQLRTENKGLLDRCLARNGYTPVHTTPAPPVPIKQDLSRNNPAIRAQDVAAARFNEFMSGFGGASNGDLPIGEEDNG